MRTVAVDWSGARNPRGRIWIAVCEDGELRSLQPSASREAAAERVLAFAGTETVIGFDFSFSLPAWFLRKHCLVSAVDLWALCRDEGERWLAACEPPFWGRPGKRRPTLTEHLRRTERAIGAVGGISPKSTFQVGGAGAVGTGSLRGMPFLLDLRAAGFAIWPFDAARLPLVVEIYPRLFTGPVVKSSATARAAYLNAFDPPLTTAWREHAESCEDAFDAAISAVLMGRRAADLRALPHRTDAVAMLEGEVFV
jgi:hypothetical protein